tara:strand:- start:643 stop:1200 length:558 start_codon:yes stop_codon:yes gene_type:complete
MVYDDPLYWDLEFYNNSQVDENYSNNDLNLNLNTNESLNLENNKYTNKECNNESCNNAVNEKIEDTKILNKSSISNMSSSSEFDSDLYSEYDSGNELDDPKDEDYEYYEESNNEDDYYYEYILPIVKKIDDHIKTRSKTKRKINLNEDNTQNEFLIKKNKNYLKNNKRKEFKNVWSRRLRQKLSY